MYLALAVTDGTARALPWYYYVFCILNPILCFAWNELCKSVDAKAERRAEKLRRLQFETRLGAFSPK